MEKIMAKDIRAKFLFDYYVPDADKQPIENKVNNWLIENGNVEVHNILYQHCLCGTKRANIASVLILYEREPTISDKPQTGRRLDF